MAEHELPEGSPEQRRNEALHLANAIVSGATDLLTGVRSLAAFADALDPDGDDEHCECIRAVAFEIEGLPMGPERAAWERKALIGVDRELRECARVYREPVLEACRGIIRTYHR